MITLLYELIHTNRKIHYDDATELKRYLDIIRLETEYGISTLSIK